MKRLSMIFCSMMITVATSAQENIEKLFHDINERNDKNLLTKSHYKYDSDAPTTFCHYTEIMKPEPAFGKLGETFIKTFTNEKEAYKIYTMTAAEVRLKVIQCAIRYAKRIFRHLRFAYTP